MPYDYPLGKLIHRNERLNITILAELPFATMFQCSHLHTLFEGSNPPTAPQMRKTRHRHYQRVFRKFSQFKEKLEDRGQYLQ